MENQNISNSSNQPAGDVNTNQAIVAVLGELLKEQKRARTTDTAFKVLIFLVIIALPFILVLSIAAIAIKGAAGVVDGLGIPEENQSFFNPKTSSRHSALIDLNGVIGDSTFEEANKDTDRLLRTINKAFADKNSVGVILRINSPGGSPTISDNLYTGIKNLRNKYPQKPFVIVAGDICASGGYYVAMAGDKIYVNQASIVGSIGVIHYSFGLDSMMDKIGITPRIFTAGKHKAFLNPFTDLSEADKLHLQNTLEAIHNRFIDVVKLSRGDRLKSNDVFNGLLWDGQAAIELGLVDGIGSAQEVAKNVLGEENIIQYSSRKFDISDIFYEYSKSMINHSLNKMGNLSY